MAIMLSRAKHTVTLVPRRMEQAMALASDRENKEYLPGITFPQTLQIGSEIKPSIMEAEVIMLACPVKGLRALCESIKPHLGDAWGVEMILTLCKGLEPTSLMTPVQVVRDVISDIAAGTLTGPTNAAQVAQGKPTAMVLASTADMQLNKKKQEAISNEQLRVYCSEDLKGVELGACLKNIFAIGAGISDGLQFGDNSKAAYLTRALHEMVKLGASLGGKIPTFYGLSGFGDVVATCHGSWSRNRTFGEELASGKTVQELLEGRKTVVEGVWATECFFELCQKHKLESPILTQLYEVLYKGKSPIEGIKALMSRALKEE